MLMYYNYYTGIIGDYTDVQYNHVYRCCIGYILYNLDMYNLGDT